jgi:hypothetical protein
MHSAHFCPFLQQEGFLSLVMHCKTEDQQWQIVGLDVRSWVREKPNRIIRVESFFAESGPELPEFCRILQPMSMSQTLSLPVLFTSVQTAHS